jgi:hypothetical protein
MEESLRHIAGDIALAVEVGAVEGEQNRWKTFSRGSGMT